MDPFATPAPPPTLHPTESVDPNETPVLTGATGAWQAKEPDWIPKIEKKSDVKDESLERRTLVICFDGTGDRFDEHNSNIIKLVSLMKKDDATKQMVYYQTGIGTASEADARYSFVRSASQALDLMFATTLGHHVRQGYEFLCQNYKRGDVICIFGFSRGAYTARALAGMVQKVGVLPPWNTGMIPFAYQMYASTEPDTLKLAASFKSTFSANVKIEFVGVWDTVASVGLVPRYLPFVSSNSSIRYFRHAVALDEHRVKFVPNYYRQSRDKDQTHVNDLDLQASNDGFIGLPEVNHPPSATNGHDSQANGALDPNRPPSTRKKSQKGSMQYRYEDKINSKTGQKTNSLEVWFAGAHCDVGGGAVPNNTRHSLARIPLRWMIRECFRCKTGIIFDAQSLRDEVGIDIDLESLQVLPVPKRLSPGSTHRIPAQPPTLEGLPFLTNVPISVVGLPFSIAKGILGKVMSPVTSRIFPKKEHDPTFEEHEPTREPFRGEAMEELLDAISPMYDQLQLAPSWWFIEFLPLRVKKELAVYLSADKGQQNYVWLQNRGEGRKIFKHVVKRGMQVHRSVLTRLEALDENGQPGTYQPWVQPNFVAFHRKGKEVKEESIHCRRMTNEEWATQKTERLEYPWFKWYVPPEEALQKNS